MNQTTVMLAVIEMARVSRPMSAEDAISLIAELIDGLDAAADGYERDVEALMNIGATIWTLCQDRK